ncbi:MAG: hotdog fold thioesterase [Candidatus Rokubacteria bacterium]|nr:hotdog fold thioesterase [Candidatus Rokubacteria bacterium]
MKRRDPSGVPAALKARLESEPWAHALGVEYEEIGPGYCRVALTLQPHMLNHQGSPHGGVIFSLADVAFGVACNSHGETAVALTMTITFLATVAPGSRLIAEGQERRQGRRAGFYDIRVRTDDGTPVASVSCLSHRVTKRAVSPRSTQSASTGPGATRTP